MIIMASLKSGLLLKLLEDMKSDEKASQDDKKPVLLQIRSIIPVLEEGDLWPNRGFYLKVSDMSHATYVSLPQDQNEMILSNELKLGQFMYVQKLEKSDPVPLLRGVTPVPGRRQCEGTPEDIISTEGFLKLLEAPLTDSVVEKAVISERMLEPFCNPREPSLGLSDTHALVRKRYGLERRHNRRIHSLSASNINPSERRMELNCIMEIADAERRSFSVKSRASSVENYSDSDSALSSFSSTRMSRRRSWNESEIFDSSVVKHETKLPPNTRCHSSTAPPGRCVRYDSSDYNSCSNRRGDKIAAKQSVKSTNKSRGSMTSVNSKQNSCPMCTLIGEKKAAETAVLWDSLPSRLVKFGKEVIRQRDIALLAAADALQEACASERLLNCLSTFSEFHLADGDDLESYVDKFFHLQDDLVHTRLIIQSLTNITPLRVSEIDAGNASSIKEALTIALERKKNATTWIKSAIAVDLSPCSNTLNPVTTTTMMALSCSAKRSGPAKWITRPKVPCISKKYKSNDNISLVLASDEDEELEWTRGSTMCAATELVASLEGECRRLFVSYVDNFLDEVERKTSSVDTDNEIAGMLHKVKKVNEWLDVILNKEANNSILENCELEACSRVRNKMCEILLKYVERTAMALENMST